MKSTLVTLLLLLVSLSVHAGELKGVKMPDTITVDGHQLALNGMGMRYVTKFGLHINVYVGALYLEKKSKDSDAILRSDEIKRLVMHFVLSVDRYPLLNGFEEGYENGCFVECARAHEQFAKFSPDVVEVRKDNEYIITFYKDQVAFEATGPYAKKAVIADAALSRNLLSVFINKKAPPGKAFRKGLLGI